MKLFKEIFFKLLLFTIFGLIYYVFSFDSYFDDGISGFICFGITFGLVDLIYYYINKKTNLLNKKWFMIVLIVITGIILLGTVLGIIDYYRAENGEEPIFTWKKNPTYAMFITYNEAGDMFEEKGIATTEYSGFGYSIIVCHEQVTCDNPVMVLPFGVGSYGVSYTGTRLVE